MLFFYQFHVHKTSMTVGYSNKHGYPSHFHEHVELLYLMSGEYSVTVDGKNYPLKAGDLVIIFPYQIHEYVRTTGNNRELVVTAEIATFPDYKMMLQNRIPRSPVLHSEHIGPECRNVLEWLAATRNHIKNVEFLRKSLINIIFWYFTQHIEMNDRPKFMLKTIQQIVKYCSEHYTEAGLSLDMVSHAIGISKYHISRLIAQEFKLSFPAYINILRINDACRLLQTTNESITAIALDCGFGTIRSFNRIFMDMRGVTPSVYRSQHQIPPE